MTEWDRDLERLAVDAVRQKRPAGEPLRLGDRLTGEELRDGGVRLATRLALRTSYSVRDR